MAAWSTDRKFLTVAVINADQSAHELGLAFKGVQPGAGKLWRMTGPDMAPSEPGARGPGGRDGGRRVVVDIAESALTAAPSTVAIPPMSISMYEFAAR
jgi:hypothetical protein